MDEGPGKPGRHRRDQQPVSAKEKKARKIQAQQARRHRKREIATEAPLDSIPLFTAANRATIIATPSRRSTRKGSSTSEIPREVNIDHDKSSLSTSTPPITPSKRKLRARAEGQTVATPSPKRKTVSTLEEDEAGGSPRKKTQIPSQASLSTGVQFLQHVAIPQRPRPPIYSLRTAANIIDIGGLKSGAASSSRTHDPHIISTQVDIVPTQLSDSIPTHVNIVPTQVDIGARSDIDRPPISTQVNIGLSDRCEASRGRPTQRSTTINNDQSPDFDLQDTSFDNGENGVCALEGDSDNADDFLPSSPPESPASDFSNTAPSDSKPRRTRGKRTAPRNPSPTSQARWKTAALEALTHAMSLDTGCGMPFSSYSLLRDRSLILYLSDSSKLRPLPHKLPIRY